MLKYLIFTLSTLFLFCDEQLTIALDTAKELMPLRIERISAGSSFSEKYLDRLVEIFSFDIEQSGYASLTSDTSFGGRVSLDFKNKALTLNVENIKKRSVKHFRDIPLTGSLDLDRRRLHQLSDATIKVLFGKEGIASRKIIFAIQFPHPTVREKYLSEIWECDYDGANLRQITQDKDYAITPRYIPSKGDAERFLYVCYKHGPPKIYINSFDKEEGEPLISLRGNQLLPAFSRDGRKLAFISDASGRADLFLQLFDPAKGPIGKPRQLYSLPNSVQASPTFSPDGNQVVFVSDQSGTPRLYLIDLKNLSERKRPDAKCLTLKNRENTGPNWSPDGRKIAYSAKTNGIRQIWMYDVETGEEEQITFGDLHKENPSFAADNLHLVYNTVDRFESELYILNLRDPQPIQITSGPGKKHYPSWEP